MQFLVVDDHGLIVQALSTLLKGCYAGSEVLTGSTVREARELAAMCGHSADLMILDLNLPGVGRTTELLEELAAANPGLKILVLSGVSDAESIMRVLQLGAAGFIPKSIDPAMLVNAIDFVLKGGVYIPVKLLGDSRKDSFLTETADRVSGNASGEVHLTDRQKDVLAALSRGLTIKGICRELNLSEGTVKTHAAAIYRAFGARNRTEALIAARRHGFDVRI